MYYFTGLDLERPKMQISWKNNAFVENALFPVYSLFHVPLNFGSESNKTWNFIMSLMFFKLILTTESHKKLGMI